MTRKFRVARRAARERRRSEEWPNPDSEGEGDDGRYSPSMSPEDESGAARVPRTRKMSLRRGAARSASRSPPSEDELRRLEELAEYICSSEEEEMWHPCHVPARLPEDEEARLATLFGLKLLDTELDGNLSCMVTLAARTFGTSMAWIALVERDREWYMAKQGIMYSQTHRDIAFGAHSILQEEAMWVEDAALDSRFKYNKLVHNKPFIRFYLSVPLFLSAGGARHAIGCLCVADEQPRDRFAHPTADDVHLLRTLASAVVRRIETRPRTLFQRTDEDMDNVENRANVLRDFVAAAGVTMSEDMIVKLSERLKPRVVQMDKFIVRKGDQANSMYFVVSGVLMCSVQDVPIERLTRGSCFGEVSVMNICKMKAANIPEKMIARRCIRMADIRSLERCELLELTSEQAWPLIRDIPALWSKLEEISKLRAGKVSVLKSRGRAGGEKGVV
eukprot:Tamp_14664.p1 GENE.Tamp_14664~~Tamp_14664.p1  ORF type:complete len:507 (+),score=77.52 Tamp_14664:183-1523(+)